jgi:hypothetical protein
MKSIANKSSFGARAMSGACNLFTLPPVTPPGVSGKQRKRR